MSSNSNQPTENLENASPEASVRPDARAASSRALYWRLLSYARPYWPAAVVALVAMAVSAGTESIFPDLMRQLLDTGFSTTKGAQTSLSYPLWWVPAIIIGLFVVRGLAFFTGSYALSYMAQHVLEDLRRQMFDRLLAMPTAEYDRQSAGLLISKLVSEVNNVTSAATQVVASLVRDSLTVIGLLGYLLYLNWRLTLVAFVLIPIIGVATHFIGQRIRRISRETQQSTGDLTRVVEEAISAQKVIKVFGGQAEERRRFGVVNRDLKQQAIKLTVTGSANVPTTQLASAIAIAVVVTLALVQSTQQQTTVGGFASFITALLMLLAPLKHLADLMPPLQRGLAAAEAVFSLIDTPAEDDHGTVELPSVRGQIRLEQVRFQYPTRDREALRGIDLQIEPGETVALVGGSGGGKSTLINLIPRFYATTGGTIYLDGVPLQDIRLESLRRHIALVSQDVVLFNGTIAANIAYGREGQVSEAAIWQALAAADLAETVRALPQGLMTSVGDRGVRLSGGQRQRLAIARAILKDAPILLLDEATSALDSETERTVQAALDALMRGRTTIVVAHRLSTIERADRIVVIDNGLVVEQGRHEALLAAQGAYARLYRLQFAES